MAINLKAIGASALGALALYTSPAKAQEIDLYVPDKSATFTPGESRWGVVSGFFPNDTGYMVGKKDNTRMPDLDTFNRQYMETLNDDLSPIVEFPGPPANTHYEVLSADGMLVNLRELNNFNQVTIRDTETLATDTSYGATGFFYRDAYETMGSIPTLSEELGVLAFYTLDANGELGIAQLQKETPLEPNHYWMHTEHNNTLTLEDIQNGATFDRNAMPTGVVLQDLPETATSITTVYDPTNGGLQLLVGAQDEVIGYNPLTGAKTGFKANVDGLVTSVHYENNTLYLGLLRAGDVSHIHKFETDDANQPIDLEALVSTPQDARAKLNPRVPANFPFRVDFDNLSPAILSYEVRNPQGSVVAQDGFVREAYTLQLPQSVVGQPFSIVAIDANGVEFSADLPQYSPNTRITGPGRINLRGTRNGRFGVNLVNNGHLYDVSRIGAVNRRALRRNGFNVRFFGPSVLPENQMGGRANITGQMFTNQYQPTINPGTLRIEGRAKANRKAYGNRNRANARLRVSANSQLNNNIERKNYRIVAKK